MVHRMKNKLIATILWFLGVMFVIRGLSLLGDSFLGGIFMALAGILLLPAVQQKLAATSSLQPKMLSIVAFILLICSGVSLKSSEDKALKNGTASPEVMARESDRKARNEQQQIADAKREATKAAEQEQRDRERNARDKAIAMEVDAELALKKFLKDPDSAQIRNQHGYCGEVNSKNSFGGYTGFRRFIASSAVVAVEGENMEPGEFQKVWEQFCA